MLAIALTLALATAGSIQEAEEDPLAVLKELVERTNALASFRVVYRLVQPGQEDTSVVFSYRSPDSLRMDKNGTGPVERMLMLAVGGRICTSSSGAGEGAWYALGDLRPLDHGEIPAMQVLERYFPDDPENLLGPGPGLEASWRLNPESNKVDLGLTLYWSIDPRRALLGWFSEMERDPRILELDGELLLQRHERYRASVSRSSGFLTELEVVAADGSVLTLALEELQLGPELDPALFEIPGRPEGARDESAQFERLVDQKRHLQHLRRHCLSRVDRQLAQERIEWSIRTRDRCTDVFRTLHESPLLEQAREYRAEMGMWIDKFCEWIARKRAAGAPLDDLRREVRAKRQQIQERLAQERRERRSRLMDAGLLPGRSGYLPELLELEKQVVGQLHDEHFRQAVLDDFDARTEETLAG